MASPGARPALDLPARSAHHQQQHHHQQQQANRPSPNSTANAAPCPPTPRPLWTDQGDAGDRWMAPGPSWAYSYAYAAAHAHQATRQLTQ